MADRTNATGTPATSTTAGVLRPDAFFRHATLVRVPVAAALAPWVENHWCVGWDLPAGTRHVNQTLPHPACTLSVELGHPRAGVGADRVLVTGVITERFDVSAAGHGWVFGVKFRPGGLAALAGLDASTITDRTLPAADLLPPATVADLRTVVDGMPAADAAEIAERALSRLVPSRPDPRYAELLAIVGAMLEDRSLVQVAQVLERHDISRRRLERLFARYVGVGPKWVLSRYRMHDVVSALDAGHEGPLADLAATYGWYDQAHFARDFTALVGTTPGEYRRISRARPGGTTR